MATMLWEPLIAFRGRRGAAVRTMGVLYYIILYHVCICICIHIYIYTYMYTYISLYIYIYTHTCVHIYIYIYTIYVFMHLFIFIVGDTPESLPASVSTRKAAELRGWRNTVGGLAS